MQDKHATAAIPPRLMRSLALALLASLACMSAAAAADCPRKDALGTSRILTVDPATWPRVGLKSFPQTLPLGDREVVLTFDDGPWPATDNTVLAALARECVRAKAERGHSRQGGSREPAKRHTPSLRHCFPSPEFSPQPSGDGRLNALGISLAKLPPD